MIEIKNVTKIYKTQKNEICALDGVSLSVERGDIFGIAGESGAGKSTLLSLINLSERPSDGEIIIDGKDSAQLGEKELVILRRKIATVFQDYNLLYQKNCIQNVYLPLKIAGENKKAAFSRGLELLNSVGLKEKALCYPSELSGGQRQRVAIARALAANPQILLCDEPTGALDVKTALSVLSLLREINERLKITVIIISHSLGAIRKICNKTAYLSGGKIVESGNTDKLFANPKNELFIENLSCERQLNAD